MPSGSNTQPATLIMCCAMPDALAYARAAQSRGERVIASSSLTYDESAKAYTHWEWLPSVYEENFCEALHKLAELRHIGRIYCPHNIAHFSLLELKRQGRLNLPLIGSPPVIEQVESMKTWLREAGEIQGFMRAVTANPLPAFKIAAILKQTDATFGESNLSKLAAMMAVFSALPQGDVVEVGSWWGKTAVALIMLAQHYATGNVLCVDPWAAVAAIQKDSSALMQTMPGITDWETVFAGFTVHTAAVVTPGAFNYLRLPSVQAEKQYRAHKSISSPEFGEVRYGGKITLIHIDGNHDYESVKADYEAWHPHVLPGGWIILDDYVWLHGDGPQKLGDSVLQRENIAHSFVAGKALFLQLA